MKDRQGKGEKTERKGRQEYALRARKEEKGVVRSKTEEMTVNGENKTGIRENRNEREGINPGSGAG